MTRPRLCGTCGANPVAYFGREDCYACVPRRRKTPWACKRCGTDRDYFSSGLCRRCHRSGPVVDSCRDCLAWGVTRHEKWLCQTCRGWRRRHEVGACPSCRRAVPINDRGFCRLCCRQATLLREAHVRTDVIGLNRDGLQLHFADLILKKRNASLRGPTEPPVQSRVGWPAGYPVAHRQGVLFEWPRRLREGQEPACAVPSLAAALEVAVDDHGRAHGWGKGTVVTTKAAVRILLGVQDTAGAPIRASEAAAVVSQLANVTVQPVLEVLAVTGMLDDDREAPLETWFARRSQALPGPMAAELRQWFLALRDGSAEPPRCRPRRTSTVRLYVSAVLPALQAWSESGHDSLREITRLEVTDALPAQAHRRAVTLGAFRSLFRFLKGRRLVFANPTARMRADRVHPGQPLPVELEPVRQAINGPDPARAALACLIAFHGPRNGDLRELQLTDIRDGRMFLPAATVVLADPVRERLAAWLDERARRWPDSVNPHLFINFYTALRTCPVSRAWVSQTLGFSAQALREDRILSEAMDCGGDVRRLCDLFGLTVGGAERYSRTVDPPSLSR